MRSLNPQHVSPLIWYYEEKNGFQFYVEDRDGGTLEGPLRARVSFVIPLRMIRKSLERYPKPRGRKLEVKK